MLGILGDLHLGPKELLSVIPDIVDRQLSTVSKIIKRYNSKGCNTFMFVGDIFDVATPETWIILDLIKFLKKQLDKGNIFYFFLGNHDTNSLDQHALMIINSLRLFIDDNKLNIIFEPTVESIAGTRLFICPHPFIEDMPKNCDFAVGHYAFKGAKADNGFILKTGYAPKGNWILGDFHTPQQGKRFIYVGSVTQIKFHEPPYKRTLLLEDGEIQSIKHTPDVILNKINIASDSDFAKIDKDIFYSVSFDPSYSPKLNWQSKYPNLVKFTVEGKKNKAAEVLMATIKSENPLSGLDNYLVSSLGFTRKQVARAYSLLGIQANN